MVAKLTNGDSEGEQRQTEYIQQEGEDGKRQRGELDIGEARQMKTKQK